MEENTKICVETEKVYYKDIDDYSEIFIAKRRKASPKTFELISVSTCFMPNGKYVLVTITYSI